MKILYDHQTFIHPYGGASRYYVEVIDYLNKESDLEVQLPLLYTQNAHLKEKGLYKSLIDNILNIKYKYSLSFRVQQLNQWNLKRHLNKGAFDIFHPTYYDTYFLQHLKGKPYVITALDMIHELGFVKGTSQVALNHKKESFEKAQHIIAISQKTKDDLINLLHIPANKISISHLATDFRPTPKIDSNQKYILFTGNRINYKNFNRFVKAIAPILLEQKDLILRLTGIPLSAEENELITSLGLKNKVVIEKFVNEARLMELYSNALCFVFPSLYEGFGIPILEAFACECPVALSNTSCFPEVAQDAGLYFDPYSEIDMRLKIRQLIDNEQLRNTLVEKGKVRLKDFSWEKTARQHELIYKAILR